MLPPLTLRPQFDILSWVLASLGFGMQFVRLKRRKFITLVLTLGLAFAIGLVAVQSYAQTWPQRTVRVILPLPPGTATDIAARLFTQRLAERWGQPVIVENRQGGDGIPAVMSFLAARDNHTLMFSFAGVITINPLIHDKLPYDPARDLVPVASVVDNFFAIAASGALKVASLEDFIRLVRCSVVVMKRGNARGAKGAGYRH